MEQLQRKWWRQGGSIIEKRMETRWNDYREKDGDKVDQLQRKGWRQGEVMTEQKKKL